MGYFGFRAAPLGPVGPGVVEAVFANFAPRRVRKAVPDAWAHASPEACIEARRTAAVAALERVAADDLAVVAPAVVDRLEGVLDVADHLGRPLFAANRDLLLPGDPAGRLWQLATDLREQRGDGHVATQACRRASTRWRCTSSTPWARASRATSCSRAGTGPTRSGPTGSIASWSGACWSTPRRPPTRDEPCTSASRRRLTNSPCGAFVAGLGSVDAVEDLAADLTPLARAVSGSGILPFPNPIGLPED